MIQVNPVPMDPALQSAIAHCQLFSRLEEANLRRLYGFCHLVTVPKGQVLFRQEQPCTSFYSVDAGLVRIFKLNPNGKEHTLHMAGPGTTFAEIAAIEGTAYPANAETLADSTLLAIEAEPFAELLAEDHDICHRVMVGLARWVRRMVGLVEDIALRDAMSRVSHYLVEGGAAGDGCVHLRSGMRHLANHLNLTPETLSRTLRRLVASDLIVHEGRTIKIVDPDGLAEAAEGLGPKV